MLAPKGPSGHEHALGRYPTPPMPEQLLTREDIGANMEQLVLR
jgi:hypothetical protein